MNNLCFFNQSIVGKALGYLQDTIFVREMGLEPIRDYSQEFLRLSWLPFHHSRKRESVATTRFELVTKGL
jgi:hypothetical protein